MGPADSHRISRAPCYSGYCYQIKSLPVRDYHPLWYDFPDIFQFWFNPNIAVLQPQSCIATSLVWAGARSLATTCAITFVFSSWGYLDVSVPLVCSPVNNRSDTASLCRVAPFGNPGIKGYLHLPRAYRSLSRPSSPPWAKASAIRSYLLFYIFLLVCDFAPLWL